jgi:predicted MFS family arabinose efflux permease
VPAERLARPARLDLLGLALLSPALVGVVWGLSRAGTHRGFGSPATVAVIAAGVVLLVAFVAHALRSSAPIVDIRLFRDRNFTAAAVLMFVAMVALLATLLLIPLYYQQVHGFSPLHAGLLLAPYGVGSALALTLAGKLTDKLGVRPVAVTGALLLLAATLALTQLSASTSQWVLAPLIALAGAGFGALLVPAQASVYGNLPAAVMPHATTAVRVFQQVGGSFGVAILAVALQHNAATARTVEQLGHAFGATCWWAAGAAALALVPALVLRTVPRPQTEPAREPELAPERV